MAVQSVAVESGLQAGDWNDLIIYVADTAWDGNRFVSQHVAERLARRAPVLYVDPPLSLLSPRRRPELAQSLREPRLRLIAPHLARLTTVVPPGVGRPLMRDIATRALGRNIARTVKALRAQPRAIIVGAVSPVLDRVSGAQRIFYATDDFTTGAELAGMDARWVKRQVDHLLRQADVVLTSSEQFAAKWPSALFVPNGCDIQAFADVESAPLPDGVTLPPPIAGFVGYISNRIDIAYLEAVADRAISLLLVGPRQLSLDSERIGPLLARPNVQWVGRQRFEVLPSYMRMIDVGLVPYADTDFNRASFPLKTLEYLAAGRGVVSTDLPATRWLDTDLITIGANPAAFADAVQQSLSFGRSDAHRSACRTFAAQHSWDRRVDRIAGILGLPS